MSGQVSPGISAPGLCFSHPTAQPSRKGNDGTPLYGPSAYGGPGTVLSTSEAHSFNLRKVAILL